MSTEFLVAHGRADHRRAGARLSAPRRRAVAERSHDGAALRWLERFERHLAHRAAPVAAHGRGLPPRSGGAAATGASAAASSDWSAARSSARAQLRRAQPRARLCRAAACSAGWPRCAASSASCCARARCSATRRSRCARPKSRQAPAAHARRRPDGAAAVAASRAMRCETRDLALMELFYSSGLRLAELTGAAARGPGSQAGAGARARQGPQGAHRAGRLAWRVRRCGSWLDAARALARAGRAGACSSAATAAARARARCSCAWPPRRAPRGCRSTCIRTCSGIHSPPICLNPVAIYAPCRSCWGTPASAPPRSTPTLISSTSPAHMTRPIRAPNAAAEANPHEQ